MLQLSICILVERANLFRFLLPLCGLIGTDFDMSRCLMMAYPNTLTFAQVSKDETFVQGNFVNRNFGLKHGVVL